MKNSCLKNHGKIEIVYYKSPIGTLKITHDRKNIYSLKKVDEKFIETTDCELSLKIKNQLDEYFIGKRKHFNIPYVLIGTEFQKKIWQILMQIPYGETRFYKDIAIMAGNEQASRAVGMANNKNPIMIIIPCHRVVGSSGKLVGYSGGLDMKKELLQLEKA
ncbi:MAG: methylated-DNA--[protein]-cysteine S-methyltransferase [Candidatus Gastranaerophilales bacterium]